jgi:purine-binding chemotaxis protein CheW
VDSPTTTWRQVVAFDLNDETYGLDIQRVQEIIRYAEPRTVAGADSSIRGVINLRGVIVPICDLKERLGLDRALDAENAKIVILETAHGAAGLIVDDVEEVVTLDADSLVAVPAFTGSAAFVEGVAKVGTRLILLLDADALFEIDIAAAFAEAA